MRRATTAGIAIPIPGAAEIVGGIEHCRVDAEIDQPLDLVNYRHAGADHNDLVMALGFRHRFHPLFLLFRSPPLQLGL